MRGILAEYGLSLGGMVLTTSSWCLGSWGGLRVCTPQNRPHGLKAAVRRPAVINFANPPNSHVITRGGVRNDGKDDPGNRYVR